MYEVLRCFAKTKQKTLKFRTFWETDYIVKVHNEIRSFSLTSLVEDFNAHYTDSGMNPWIYEKPEDEKKMLKSGTRTTNT